MIQSEGIRGRESGTVNVLIRSVSGVLIFPEQVFEQDERINRNGNNSC